MSKVFGHIGTRPGGCGAPEGMTMGKPEHELGAPKCADGLRVKSNPASRLGVASLGMLLGMAFGFFLAVAATVTLAVEPSFPRFVFGGAAIGLAAGSVYPQQVWNLAEGTLHVVFGTVSAQTDSAMEPNHDAPWYLKLAFWSGFAFFFLALLLW